MANIKRSSFVVSAGSGSPAAAPAALRGRGAVTNVGHRYQSDTRVAPLENDWAPEAAMDAVDAADAIGESGSGEKYPHAARLSRLLPPKGLERPGDKNATSPPAPATQVRPEQVRTLLSRNDSPDIPFDLAVNPYRGCEHGCAYCYARPTHAYLGHSPGLDFETKLVAKVNAVAALRAELARPGHRVSPINLGSATDIYQPIERQWRLTRGLLELMLETRHPLTLVTKNALVERDLDLLAALAERNLVVAYVSITTLDTGMARALEPRASAPWRRLQAVRALADAGVPVGVLAAPMIPFINDDALESILAEAAGAGARWAGYTVVRLPWEVHAVFEQWLRAHFPDRADRVLHRIEDLRGGRRNDSRFGVRMRGTGLWADLLRQRFTVAARKQGLNLGPSASALLDCGQFIPPVLDSSRGHGIPRGIQRGIREAAPSSQLSLFPLVH